MSAEQRSNRNLNDQLRAFGAALQQNVAEDITPHPHGSAAQPGSPPSRGWPLMVGVAATVIALIAGFAWLTTRNRSLSPATEPTVALAPSTPDAPTPLSTVVATAPVSTQPPTTVQVAVPLANAVGSDPLRLLADGAWALEERREEPLRWAEPDEPNECLGIEQHDSIAGRPTIYERYSTTGTTFIDLDVTYIDAGTAENAAIITEVFDRLGPCGQDPASTPLPSGPAAGAQGVEPHGHRIGETFAVIAMRRAGNLVVTVELEDQGVTDDLIADLVQRSATLLATHSSVQAAAAIPTNASAVDPVLLAPSPDLTGYTLDSANRFAPTNGSGGALVDPGGRLVGVTVGPSEAAQMPRGWTTRELGRFTVATGNEDGNRTDALWAGCVAVAVSGAQDDTIEALLGGFTVDGGDVTVRVPDGWTPLVAGAHTDEYQIDFTASVSDVPRSFMLAQMLDTNAGHYLGSNRAQATPVELDGGGWILRGTSGWNYLVFQDGANAVLLGADATTVDELLALRAMLSARQWSSITADLPAPSLPTPTTVAMPDPPLGCPTSLTITE